MLPPLLQVVPFAFKYTSTAFDRWRLRRDGTRFIANTPADLALLWSMTREEVVRLQGLRGTYGIKAPAPICAETEEDASCQVVQAPAGHQPSA